MNQAQMIDSNKKRIELNMREFDEVANKVLADMTAEQKEIIGLNTNITRAWIKAIWAITYEWSSENIRIIDVVLDREKELTGEKMVQINFESGGSRDQVFMVIE